MKLLRLLAIGPLLIGPALAQEPIPALKALAKWRGIVGETVVVSGCRMSSANASSVFCEAGVIDGLARVINVDSVTMDPADLEYALEHCAGYTFVAACLATVTGVVTDLHDGPQIVQARVTWQFPA